MPQDTLPCCRTRQQGNDRDTGKETAAQQFISNSHNAGISRKAAQQVNDRGQNLKQYGRHPIIQSLFVYLHRCNIYTVCRYKQRRQTTTQKVKQVLFCTVFYPTMQTDKRPGSYCWAAHVAGQVGLWCI